VKNYMLVYIQGAVWSEGTTLRQGRSIHRRSIVGRIGVKSPLALRRLEKCRAIARLIFAKARSLRLARKDAEVPLILRSSAKCMNVKTKGALLRRGNKADTARSNMLARNPRAHVHGMRNRSIDYAQSVAWRS
jgi:hypothetical protein